MRAGMHHVIYALSTCFSLSEFMCLYAKLENFDILNLQVSTTLKSYYTIFICNAGESYIIARVLHDG